MQETRKISSSAFIQAVAYQGTVIAPQTVSAYQRDARDITGPLDQQIFEACDFVRKNMQVAAKKGSAGGREDIPQFDMLAVFEAVTNAVAHRDYSMSGSKVRLRLFDDRLELFTPGLLANTMTTESLPTGRLPETRLLPAYWRVARLNGDDFKSHRTHIMDKRGEGGADHPFSKRGAFGHTPEYRLIDESELLLTIYATPGS
ncbi:MAG: ATP-binding protein [Pseudomonadales bacterium]